jgi:hypothetical protein
MISLGFKFREVSYNALIRLRESGIKKEYVITVMNGELEKILYGNHILVEENGEFLSNTEHAGEKAFELRTVITKALQNYLALTFRL